MPPPYEFRFDQNANNVTWTDAGGAHTRSYRTGESEGPFTNSCDALSFLNGAIDAGVPLQESARDIYEDVATQCATSSGGAGGVIEVPADIPPADDPSATGTDNPPPQSQETPDTLNAPDPGAGGTLLETPPPSDTPDPRPLTTQYFDPYPAPDYDIASQLLEQGIQPGDLDAALQSIFRNEPRAGQPHDQFGGNSNDIPLVVLDPVDVFSGSYTISTTDVALPSSGFPLVLTRFYRSGPVYFGPWGFNWDHNYNVYLRELTTGGVAVWIGALSEHVYKPGTAIPFDPPPGVFSSLEFKPATAVAPDRYVITDRDGRSQVFARPAGWPLGDRIPLVTLSDRHDNRHELSYDAEGRLDRVADGAGRFIRFGYGDCGLLEQVEDHTGRRWRYFHDVEAEHLEAFITPPTVAHPDGLTTRYAYDRYAGHPQLRHNLIEVVGADGRTIVQNEYESDPSSDDFGRVVRQEYGGFEATFHATALQYVPRVPDAANVPALRVETFDPGVLHVFTFNFRGDLLDHRFRLARDGSYRLVARTYRYDGQGNLIERREPNGLGMLFTYDDASVDPRARGNLLKLELVGPPTAIVASRIVSEITYEPQFHRPKTHRDERGHITTWTYDYELGAGAVGDVVAMRSPDATLPDGTAQVKVDRFAYDAAGNVHEHTRPTGLIDRYTFGAALPEAGLLTRVVYDVAGAGESVQYEYDVHGGRSATIDGLGRRTEVVRDEMGWITSVRLPTVGGVGDEVRFAYAPSGLVRREELPRGEYTDATITDAFIANEFEYDALGHRTASRYGTNTARPLSVRFVPDDEGRLLELTDELGRRTRFFYDERGLPLSRVDAYATPVEAASKYHYDRNGNMTSWVDAVSLRFDYQYDPWDRLRRFRLPGAPEADRTLVELELDPSDRPTRVRVSGRTSPVAVGTISERLTTYDERGRAIRHTLGGRIVEVTYDEEDRPLAYRDQRGAEATFEYDGLGRVTRSQDAEGNVVERGFDAAGQLISMREIDMVGGAAAAARTTTIAYDERARPIRVTDPLGNVTVTDYDARDLAVATIDAVGRAVEREFGLRADLESVSATVAAGVTATSKFGFDEAGRNISYVDPEGHVTRFEFDERDRRTAIVYADGRVHRFMFDHRIQAESEVTPGGTAIDYAYGPDGAISGITFTPGPGVAPTAPITIARDGVRRPVALTQGGLVVQRSYDSLQRLVSEETDGRLVTVTFDEATGTAALTYPDGRVDELRFDLLGRLEGIDLQTIGGEGLTGPLAAGTTLAAYEYWGERINRRVLANGVTTAFDYDAAGRLTDIDHQGPAGQQIARIHYIHDAAGWRRVVWAAPDPLGADRYDYDGVGRLRRAELDLALPEPASAPAQNVADAAILGAEAAASASSEAFTLRLDDTRTVLDVQGAGPALHETYAVDALGRIAQVVRTGPGAGTYPFLFDGDGRCIRDDRHDYSYDALGRLLEIRAIGGAPIVQQTYDAANRVVRRTQGGVTQRYAYHAMRAVEAANAAGSAELQKTFGIDLDEITIESDGGNRFDLHDAALSLICATDANGDAIERYRYDSFGQPHIFAANGTTPRAASAIGAVPQFGGHPYLTGGIFDARARAYDADSGRFLQPDPFGFENGASLYAYAYDDPIGHVDPTGEVGLAVGLLIVAGVGLVAGAGTNAVRQGIQIHEGSRDEFSIGEMAWSGGVGAIAAPVLTVAPELAIPLAAYGVGGGINEISQGHYETGTFDIATSLLPFASSKVRTAAWGEGSYIGQVRGLGPSATSAERFARFPMIADATRDVASRAWNRRFFHGHTEGSINAAVRDPIAHARMVRYLQSLPGARHLGPGLYFGESPGNPSIPGSPAWWAARGGSVGLAGRGGIVEVSVPRWRMFGLRRMPGVALNVEQAGLEAPQSFFPFEGPINRPGGPAMRVAEIGQWRVYDPNAAQPSFGPLWPTLLTPQARWPSAPPAGSGFK